MSLHPLLKKYVGTVIRLVILLVGINLDEFGITSDQVDGAIDAVTVAGVTVWSLWQKTRSQREVHAALALPKGSAVTEVEDVLKRGAAPPAMLPTDATPVLKS